MARNPNQYVFWKISFYAFSSLFLFNYIPWDMVGYWWRYSFLVAMVLALSLGIKKSWKVCLSQSRLLWLLPLTITFFALFGSYFLFHSKPDSPYRVDLQWPLSSGKYAVRQGGVSLLNNHHHSVKAQKYALDIVALNQWGMRAHGLFPKRDDQYEIYERAIISPCAGEVIMTEEDIDLEFNPAGNFVVIHCQGASIMLAHLEGSSERSRGEYLHAGEPIGFVGNTGNSTEPHLHIHAVRGEALGLRAILFTQEPVMMYFNDQFFVRNDVFYVD